MSWVWPKKFNGKIILEFFSDQVVKDPALSRLWLGFIPGLGSFGTAEKKKEKRKYIGSTWAENLFYKMFH